MIESSLNEESISIYSEVVKDIDDDELSQDTAMRAMSFAQSKVNSLYKDKPLPGFIKLRSDAKSESDSTEALQREYEKSPSYPAIIKSAHTMHDKADVRRGQTGSLYHRALPMTEILEPHLLYLGTGRGCVLRVSLSHLRISWRVTSSRP